MTIFSKLLLLALSLLFSLQLQWIFETHTTNSGPLLRNKLGGVFTQCESFIQESRNARRSKAFLVNSHARRATSFTRLENDPRC
jgi:hypothetical protein